MKGFILTTAISLATLFTHMQSSASEIIDNRTVYTPNLNICVSSFGGFILSSEIKYFSGAKTRILKAEQVLERWISESNSSEFYLKQFDQDQFYWQFVETKKFIGAILIVTADSIENEFYNSLGAGLNISGSEYYGLRTPATLNGDVFSFVVNKETCQLDFFENWKFAEEADAPLEISKFQSRNLLNKNERDTFERSRSNKKVSSETRAEFLVQDKVAKNGYYAISVLSRQGFISNLLTLSAH